MFWFIVPQEFHEVLLLCIEIYFCLTIMFIRIAYLMRKYDLNLIKAHAIVKRFRP